MQTPDIHTQRILSTYESLQQKNSNLVMEVLPKNAPNYLWHHYPEGDIKDPANHSQYYYHAHPSKDHDRVPEHGHFHVFYRYERFHKDDPIIITSEKFQETNGKHDNLTHLIAIAMNEFGYPTALFTVNYWVVLGVWRSAEVLIQYLDEFIVNVSNNPYSLNNIWLSSLIQVFKPQIAELLKLRDEVILDFSKQHSESNVFYNKDLEITSVLAL